MLLTVVLFISLNQINIWFGNVLLDQLKVKGHSPAKEFKMVLFPEPGFTRAIVSVRLQKKKAMLSEVLKICICFQIVIKYLCRLFLYCSSFYIITWCSFHSNLRLKVIVIFFGWNGNSVLLFISSNQVNVSWILLWNMLFSNFSFIVFMFEIVLRTFHLHTNL